MIFILLILFAVFAYIRGYKVTALVVFFFFVTTGYNLLPDELVDLGTPFTKNSDYAFFILLGFLTIEAIFHWKKTVKIDVFARYLILFFGFLAVCVLYNRYMIGVGWGDIIRTVRYLFFWFAYFVFRNMEKEQLLGLMKCLFIVTVATSAVFLLQIVLNQNILVEAGFSEATVFGITFPRYYNQPAMLHFFVFIAIYNNPYKGTVKILTTAILLLAFFGAFHRSLIALFLFAVSIGYFLKLSKIRRVQVASIASIVGLFVVLYAGNKFMQTRTYSDIQKVMAGNVMEADIDVRDLYDATFAFRIAHLLERDEYIRRSPASMLFGGALLSEDSKMLDKFFDFQIGLIEELTGNVTQVDTGDISYSLLILRFGYLGTILYMLLYIYMLYYFYRNRKHPMGLLSFLYLIMILGLSFFSSNLTLAPTFLMPMLSYSIVQKAKIDEQ